MKFPVLIVALAVLLAAVGCSSEHEEHEEEHVRFLVTNPLLKDTSIIHEYVCQIHAIQHIELRALERGYLEHIHVDEGQRVARGQMMFQLMPVIYQAEFHQAEAEARVAEIEYRNTKALADSNVVSPNELAIAKARYDRAKAQVALADAHLSFTRIKAPFNGIMDRLHVRQGSLLEEGDMLATLSDNSQMWVYFNVPEAEYLNYRTNTPEEEHTRVRLKMANGQLFDQVGEVTTIEADFNNETGNIAFRATFPNPNGLLRHGETGNIQMTSEIKQALLIPQKSTFEVLDKRYVFVVSKDGSVHQRSITISAELPHLYVVSSGLQEGDTILLEGLRKVRENMKIQSTYLRPDSVMHSLDLYAE